MTHKYLVTYATKYGSTTGVAEAIAKTLMENGHQVDLLPAKEVRSVDGYDAIIVGSPLYIGSILSDVSKFLARHKDALTKIPTGFFVLGPLESSDAEYKSGREQLDSVLKKPDWFKPAASEVFVGVYDPKILRFPESLINLFPANPLKGRPATDNRDWDAIRTWATSLRAALKI